MNNRILAAALLFALTAAAAAPDGRGSRRETAHAHSAQSRTVKFEALPDAAQAFLRDFYARDRVERIRCDPSARIFAYKVRLDNGDEIIFARSGEWTDIESAGGIPMKLIPQQVADYVKNKYPRQSVTDIGLERSGISVRLTDGTELLFESDEHNLQQQLKSRPRRTEASGRRMHDSGGERMNRPYRAQ